MKIGQIWVENVIYILIGLTLITAVLAIAFPQINKIKDKAIVEQTISALEDLNKIINEVKQTEGNIRIVQLKNSRGNIYIDGEKDVIKYELEDTNLELSEVDSEINYGEFTLLTTNYGSKYKITIWKNYTSLDFKINKNDENKDEIETLQPGSTAYKITIENEGISTLNKKNIVFTVE
jgi:type II secretory pathway pseudopilin PulG